MYKNVANTIKKTITEGYWFFVPADITFAP